MAQQPQQPPISHSNTPKTTTPIDSTQQQTAEPLQQPPTTSVVTASANAEVLSPTLSLTQGGDIDLLQRQIDSRIEALRLEIMQSLSNRAQVSHTPNHAASTHSAPIPIGTGRSAPNLSTDPTTTDFVRGQIGNVQNRNFVTPELHLRYPGWNGSAHSVEFGNSNRYDSSSWNGNGNFIDPIERRERYQRFGSHDTNLYHPGNERKLDDVKVDGQGHGALLRPNRSHEFIRNLLAENERLHQLYISERARNGNRDPGPQSTEAPIPQGIDSGVVAASNASAQDRPVDPMTTNPVDTRIVSPEPRNPLQSAPMTPTGHYMGIRRMSMRPHSPRTVHRVSGGLSRRDYEHCEAVDSHSRTVRQLTHISSQVHDRNDNPHDDGNGSRGDRNLDLSSRRSDDRVSNDYIWQYLNDESKEYARETERIHILGANSGDDRNRQRTFLADSRSIHSNNAPNGPIPITDNADARNPNESSSTTSSTPNHEENDDLKQNEESGSISRSNRPTKPPITSRRRLSGFPGAGIGAVPRNRDYRKLSDLSSIPSGWGTGRTTDCTHEPFQRLSATTALPSQSHSPPSHTQSVRRGTRSQSERTPNSHAMNPSHLSNSTIDPRANVQQRAERHQLVVQGDKFDEESIYLSRSRRDAMIRNVKSAHSRSGSIPTPHRNHGNRSRHGQLQRGDMKEDGDGGAYRGDGLAERGDGSDRGRRNGPVYGGGNDGNSGGDDGDDHHDSHDPYGYVIGSHRRSQTVSTAIGSYRAREGMPRQILNRSRLPAAALRLQPIIRRMTNTICTRFGRSAQFDLNVAVLQVQSHVTQIRQQISDESIIAKFTEEMVKDSLKKAKLNTNETRPDLKWSGKDDFIILHKKIITYCCRNGIKTESKVALGVLIEALSPELKDYMYSIMSMLDEETILFALLFVITKTRIDIGYFRRKFENLKQKKDERIPIYLSKKMESYDDYRNAHLLYQHTPAADYRPIARIPHQRTFGLIIEGIHDSYEMAKQEAYKAIARKKTPFNDVDAICNLLMEKGSDLERLSDLKDSWKSQGNDSKPKRYQNRNSKGKKGKMQKIDNAASNRNYFDRKRNQYQYQRGYRGKKENAKTQSKPWRGGKTGNDRRGRYKNAGGTQKNEKGKTIETPNGGRGRARGGRKGRGRGGSRGSKARFNLMDVNVGVSDNNISSRRGHSSSSPHYITHSRTGQTSPSKPPITKQRKSNLHIVDENGDVETKVVNVIEVDDGTKSKRKHFRIVSQPIHTLDDDYDDDAKLEYIEKTDDGVESKTISKPSQTAAAEEQKSKANAGGLHKKSRRRKRRRRSKKPIPRSYYKRSAVVDEIISKSKTPEQLKQNVLNHWRDNLGQLFDDVQTAIALNVHPESRILAKMAKSEKLRIADFIKMNKLCKSARRPKTSGLIPHQRSWNRKKGSKRNRLNVYKSLERIHQKYPADVDPSTVPKEDIVSLNLSIDRQNSIGKPTALADTGATFNVITEDGIAILREMAGEPIHIRQGSKQYVENGSGDDVLYDGRYIELSVERPTAPGHYVMIRFDVSPVPISFNFILGGKMMKALGYITVLADANLENIYIHRRESLNFDVERDGPIYEMMDYFNGDTISDFRTRIGMDSTTNDPKVDALIDGGRQHKNDGPTNALRLSRNDGDSENVQNGDYGNCESSDLHSQSVSQVPSSSIKVDNVDVEEQDTLDLDAYDLSEKSENVRVPLDSIESIHDVPDDIIKERRAREKKRNRFHVFEVTTQNEDDEAEQIEEEYTLESLLEFDEYYEDALKEKTKKDIRTIITDVWNRRWVAPKYIAELKRLCLKYSHRMAVSKFDMGCINGFEYKIRLKPNTSPIGSTPYNAGPEAQRIIDETVEVLLAAGVIEPYDGPWGAPVLVVENGDGSMRLCVDYSRRNKVTVSDSYPCPNVNDALPQFRGKSIFSTFDICKAFHNIKVAEEDKEKTAFVTKKGAYVWNVMPFGGKNCPATWARASDWVFRHLTDVVKYVDDIAIASTDERAHLKAIEGMFERISRYNLKLKLSKCEFFKREIKFVGHSVSFNRVAPCKEYIRKVIRLKRPTKSGIGSFCGFLGWLAKYCFRLKTALEPISRLNRKNVDFVWGPEQEQAFILCQQIIDSADVLRMPDHTKPFYIWCDASEKAYGAVIMQRDEESDLEDKMVPVEFMSKVWQPSQVNWGMTTKEMAAMKEAIKKWDHLLLYNHFHVHTDAKNIEWLWKRLESMNKKGNPMHARWMYTLKPYSFDVKHIPGVENVVADWLSRYNDYDQLAQNIASKRFDADFGYDSSSDSDSDDGPEYILKHDTADLAAVAQKNVDYKLKAASSSDDITGMEDIVSIIKEKKEMEQHRKSLMLVRHHDKDRTVELVDKTEVIERTSIQRLYDRMVDDVKCEADDSQSMDSANRGGDTNDRNFVDSLSPTTDELYRWHQELGKHDVHDEYARDLRNQQLFYVTTSIFGQRLDDHSRNRMDLDSEHIMFLQRHRGYKVDCTSLSHDDIRKLDELDTQRLYPIRDRNLLSNGSDYVPYSQPRNEREEDDDAGAGLDEDSNSDTSSISDDSYDSDIDGDSTEDWEFDIRETPTPPPDRFSYDLDVVQQYELLTQPARGYRNSEFDRDEIIYNQKRDPYIRIVRNYLESKEQHRSPNVGDWKSRWKQLTPRMKYDLKADRYYLDDDCLMFKHSSGRRLIVLAPEHRKAYLEYFHHNMLPAVHSSARRMAKFLIRRYYWPGYQKDIQDYVRGCICCQMNKGRANPYGLMKLFTPIRPGQMVSIDNKGPIEPRTSRGNLYVTSVIDRFSGKVWAYPVKAIDSYSCCRIMMRWIAEEGVPDHLLSDHGKDFTSKLVRKLMDVCGIKQLFSTTYHPECNGTVERWHRTMGEMMKCIATEYGQDFGDGDDWDSYIPLVAASHNNTFSDRIKMTPNEAYSGRRITFPVDKNANLLDINDVDGMQRDAVIAYNDWITTGRNMAIKAASLELEKYDRARRDYYERLHKPPKWRRGMKVFHWAGPKYSAGLMMGTFKSNWSGPYRIKKVLHNGSSYKLDDGVGGSFKAPLHRLRPCYERDQPGYGNRQPRHNPNVALADDNDSSDSSSTGDDSDGNSEANNSHSQSVRQLTHNSDYDDALIIQDNHGDDEKSDEDQNDQFNDEQQQQGQRSMSNDVRMKDSASSDRPRNAERQSEQSDSDSDDMDHVLDVNPIGNINDVLSGSENSDIPNISGNSDDIRNRSDNDYNPLALKHDNLLSDFAAAHPEYRTRRTEDRNRNRKSGRDRAQIERRKAASKNVYRPSDDADPTLSVVREGTNEDIGSGPRSTVAPEMRTLDPTNVPQHKYGTRSKDVSIPSSPRHRKNTRFTESVLSKPPPLESMSDNRRGQKRTIDELSDAAPEPSSKRNRLSVLQNLRRKTLQRLQRIQCELDTLNTEDEDRPIHDEADQRIVHHRGGRTVYFGRL